MHLLIRLLLGGNSDEDTRLCTDKDVRSLPPGCMTWSVRDCQKACRHAVAFVTQWLAAGSSQRSLRMAVGLCACMSS